jgi:hypothetical protein
MRDAGFSRRDMLGTGEAQQPGRPLPEFTRAPACGAELLDGGRCTRKESFPGFGQADTARRAINN